jgi:SAM-dependent methyltransferase
VLDAPFLSLGDMPISNAYVRVQDLSRPESRYPLDVFACARCFLVQLGEIRIPSSIFGADYAYFSSFSESWLAHCRAFTELAVARFSIGATSRVVEVASNDGYLLQYFAALGVPVLGIEPSGSVAAAARAKGIRTDETFFGSDYARTIGDSADLLIANNVLAHVPDINDFVEGIARALSPTGVATLEFPHLLRMLEGAQFDTIYHEHYSYLSLTAVETLFVRHELEIFDVDELPTHGGSLRLYAQRTRSGRHSVSPHVAGMIRSEAERGLRRPETYARFGANALAIKDALVVLLTGCRTTGQRVVGYGAPAKGNTLLNYCGIGCDLVAYTVDRSPHKQGLYLPGSHLPIHAPERLFIDRPDCVLILPWNLETEIVHQLGAIRDWGGRFIVPIPEPRFLP